MLSWSAPATLSDRRSGGQAGHGPDLLPLADYGNLGLNPRNRDALGQVEFGRRFTWNFGDSQR